MEKDLTELVFILDKSGSMSGLEKDTIGGFNSLIEKQKKEEGDAIVSVVLFNDKAEVICNRQDINNIHVLTEDDYYVDGCTALLDAVGNAIKHIKRVQDESGNGVRPNRTLFIITTDGLENSSREYTYKDVKKIIDCVKEKDQYEFIFLGANIDSEEEASKLGIDKEQAVNYNCDKGGIELNYSALNEAINKVRKGKKLSASWHKDIDKDVESRNK